ncbi:unnamed protein product, partial [Ectocarpus sp. 12 AP-2014]
PPALPPPPPAPLPPAPRRRLPMLLSPTPVRCPLLLRREPPSSDTPLRPPESPDRRSSIWPAASACLHGTCALPRWRWRRRRRPAVPAAGAALREAAPGRPRVARHVAGRQQRGVWLLRAVLAVLPLLLVEGREEGSGASSSHGCRLPSVGQARRCPRQVSHHLLSGLLVVVLLLLLIVALPEGPWPRLSTSSLPAVVSSPFAPFLPPIVSQVAARPVPSFSPRWDQETPRPHQKRRRISRKTRRCYAHRRRPHPFRAQVRNPPQRQHEQQQRLERPP